MGRWRGEYCFGNGYGFLAFFEEGCDFLEERAEGRWREL